MSTPADILFQVGDTSPSPPTAGKMLLYAKTDNLFYQMSPLGIETPLGSGGSGGNGTGIDGGTPTSIYGGTGAIDGGTP